MNTVESPNWSKIVMKMRSWELTCATSPLSTGVKVNYKIKSLLIHNLLQQLNQIKYLTQAELSTNRHLFTETKSSPKSTAVINNNSTPNLAKIWVSTPTEKAHNSNIQSPAIRLSQELGW